MSTFLPLDQEEQLGRYRLSARLGIGGMAEVFLGRLLGAGGFEKLVAIKRILPHLSSDPAYVAMFQDEGRIVAELNHPNICQVYELGEEDGQLFLAMELLRGLPWTEIVPAIPDSPEGPFVRFIVGAITQACEGLHHAHTATDVTGAARPCVHRDVTPSNLFVTSTGTVKVLDFGVAKLLNAIPKTRTGILKGKLPYMSPEQSQGKPVDARTDIFAIATVTWEALAGRSLFDRETEYETWRALLEDELPQLPGDSPVIARLDSVLRQALAREPERRPATARAFAEQLRKAIATHGEPMSAGEIQAHVMTWLGPSVDRKSRDLAGLVGRLRGDEAPTVPSPTPRTPVLAVASQEVTGVHSPTPSPDARLRDESAVVDVAAGETATVETPAHMTPTLSVESAAAPALDAPAMSIEVTAPRAAVGDSTRVMSPPPPPPPDDHELETTTPKGKRQPRATPAPATTDDDAWPRWWPLGALLIIAVVAALVAGLWPTGV